MKRFDSYSESTTETFWTRNVRVITFLICIALFLGVVVPVVGYHMYGYFQTEEEPLDVMGEEELLAIYDRIKSSGLSLFDAYRKESVGEWVVAGKTGRTLFVDVGSAYYLTVMEEVERGVIVYAVLTERESKAELDLFDKETDKAALRAFLARD